LSCDTVVANERYAQVIIVILMLTCFDVNTPNSERLQLCQIKLRIIEVVKYNIVLCGYGKILVNVAAYVILQWIIWNIGWTESRYTVINLLAPELFFLILAHPVYKMWTTLKPNTLELWMKLHFEEKKRRMHTMFKIFSTYICWINI